ncbi:MAG: crossover junction endodeoxyribonuclease RuvC [Bacillota bacterium]
MLILGVDPGTATTGYAVVAEEANRLLLHDCGVLRTSSDSEMPLRLVDIYRGVSDLIERYRPEAVAIEKLYFNRNVGSAMTVGQARGVVMLAAGQCGLGVLEYSPPEVKAAVTGQGNASKMQVQLMVKSLFALDAIPTPDDAADAAAVAVCALNRRGWDQRVEDGR